MSHQRTEGVDLVDAFPDFDASVYGIEPAAHPKKLEKHKRKEKRERRRRHAQRRASD